MKGLISTIKKQFIGSEFRQAVLKLVSGTGLAQLVVIALTPVLTTLFSPEAFGQYGLFLSLTNLLTVSAAAAYEQAIILPKSNRKASHLLVLCWMIISAYAICIFTGVFIYTKVISEIGGTYHKWLFIIPLSVTFLSLTNTYVFWLNRFKQYNSITITNMMKRGLSILMQISAALIVSSSVFGLIAGYITALVFTVIVATIASRKTILTYMKSWNVSSIKKVAKEYISFPKYSAFSFYCASLSFEIPVFFLSAFYLEENVGYYVLARQLLHFPMALIGTNISTVFVKQASLLRDNRNELLRFFFNTMKKLFLMGFIPILVVLLWGDHLFLWVFGETWKTAGVYAQILAPWSLLTFTFSPVSQILLVLEKNKLGLITQLATIIIRATTLVLASLAFDSIIYTLICFSFVNCLLVAGHVYIRAKAILNH